MERRAADRRANFKKNFDDPRRKREDLQVQIRRSQREQNFAKKRNDALNEDTPGVPGAPSSPPENSEDFSEMCLPALMKDLQSGDREKELKVTRHLRRALSIEQNPPIQEIIDAGAVPFLVRFLCQDDANLQFEAAWALTNIASGTHEQTQEVIKCGAVPLFVELLRSPKDDVREQAVWALGNIAGDSPECRDLVLNSAPSLLRCKKFLSLTMGRRETADALAPLLEQLNLSSTKLPFLRNATWTLSNFCRGKPAVDFDKVAPALTTLSVLVFNEDVEVLADACWALSYLSDGPNDRIELVIQAGVANRLVDLLAHPSPLVQTPALRAVGNIVTGDDRQTQVIISCGAVPKLLSMLSATRKSVQKEACWTLSNITAGNREQIQEVIDQNVFPSLLEILKTGEYDTKKEAAWAVSNAVSGGSEAQVDFLVGMGCVAPLCDLLEFTDEKIVLVALEALHRILHIGKKHQEDHRMSSNPYADMVEDAGGATSLEKLQDCRNEKVYSKVLKIIGNFFQYDEVNEGAGSTDAPETSGFGAGAPAGGFHFG